MADIFSQCSLVVFAKAPIAGQVKTRMQPALNGAQSVLLHRRMVEHCLSIVAPINWQRLELWVAGSHSWWDTLAEQYPLTVFLQSGLDLGERMANAAASVSLRRPIEVEPRAAYTIIIGTDCPYLNESYLSEAVESLTKHDVVLGPAEDGGYVLIGFKQLDSEIFADIEWGSDKVMTQTKNKLLERKLSWHELRLMADIDRPEDLRMLNKSMPELLHEIPVV